MQKGSEPSQISKQPTSDDWRLITDRKAKKRIQNRVAQRTYRNRLKQRLEELQQQVDAYQRAEAENQSAESKEPTSPPPNSLQSVNSTKSSICDDKELSYTSRYDNDSAIYDMCRPLRFPPEHGQCDRDRQSYSNISWERQEVDSFTPTSLTKTESPTKEHLQFQQPDMWNTFHCETNLNYLRESSIRYCPDPFYNKLETRTNGLLPCKPHSSTNINYAPSYPPQSSSTTFNSPSTLNSMLEEQSPCGAMLPLRTSEGINGADLGSTLSQFQGREETLDLPAASSNQAVTIAETWKLPSKHAPAEERLEYLLACAKGIGFDSFENILAQFYELRCEDNSHLAIEQWLGRSRRLPALLAQLRNQTASWAQWEQRGYQEEILKSAKNVWAIE